MSNHTEFSRKLSYLFHRIAYRFTCKHQRTCAIVRAWLLIGLMAFGAGSVGYYLNDFKNEVNTLRLERAYNAAMLERDKRLEELTRLEHATTRVDKAADKSLQAADSIQCAAKSTNRGVK